MQAIETYYRGFRFRSRLEARWAVYFDYLGVEFLYELEGFILTPGIGYLPDFHLPQIDCWVEVKPMLPGFDSPDGLKPFLFGVQTKGIYLVTDGAPNNWLMYIGFKHIEHGNLAVITTRKDGEPCVLLRSPTSEDFTGFYDIGLDLELTTPAQLENYELIRMRKAHEIARQYRFENEQNPK